jgi:hypothetical protein
MTCASNPKRHPELVSGSIISAFPIEVLSVWMLKQVQHDGFWFAQNPLMTDAL